MQGVDKHQLGDDHRQPLEQHRLRTGVTQVLNLEHLGIEEARQLAEEPFEGGKEGWVVEGPF